jgi:spore coat polysaccharide biosynthesis protein SpsF
MNSSRLPGKALIDLCGKPVLEHVITRLRKVENAPHLVVTTTDTWRDEPIIELCRRLNVSFFRGSENNIVERCTRAAEAFGLDAFVRLGADEPFADWRIITEMVDTFLIEHGRGNQLEYLGSGMDRSFPIGLDADVMTRGALYKLADEIKNLPEDERVVNEQNVIPYIQQHPEIFNIAPFRKDYDYSHLRWTLDTAEDYEFTKKIYQALYRGSHDFLMDDILAVLAVHPEWSLINSHVVQRTGYWTQTEKKKLAERQSMEPVRACA